MGKVTFPQTYKHNRSVDAITASQIDRLQPCKIVDVGCGDGFYGAVCRQIVPNAVIHGVESSYRWYSHCMESRDYDEVVLSSAIAYQLPYCDLVIFGDVLEHMDKSVAMECLSMALEKASYVIVNGPIGFQPQDHDDPEEVHRCGITKEDFDEERVIEYNETEFGVMMNCLMRGRP